jgi:hypothetical protein
LVRSRRRPAARKEPRLEHLRVRAAAIVAAALVASAARAAPRVADPLRRGLPSPAAIAYVTRKCAECHGVPPVGSRWAAASVSMHSRRMAIAARDWPLLREYFGEVRAER